METKEAVDNIDAICSVKGVDCCLIGPNDLSIALGKNYIIIIASINNVCCHPSINGNPMFLIYTSSIFYDCCRISFFDIYLGCPGQQDSEIMISAIDRVITACNRAGVIPGIHINDVKLACKWKARGMKLISSGIYHT